MQNFLINSIIKIQAQLSLIQLKFANKFNENFVQVGPQLAKKIPNDNSMSYKNYLQGNYAESIFINPVTENELLTKTINLKENKSAGYDEINAAIVKSIASEIVESLTHIYDIFIYIFLNLINNS